MQHKLWLPHAPFPVLVAPSGVLVPPSDALIAPSEVLVAPSKTLAVPWIVVLVDLLTVDWEFQPLEHLVVQCYKSKPEVEYFYSENLGDFIGQVHLYLVNHYLDALDDCHQS